MEEVGKCWWEGQPYVQNYDTQLSLFARPDNRNSIPSSTTSNHPTLRPPIPPNSSFSSSFYILLTSFTHSPPRGVFLIMFIE